MLYHGLKWIAALSIAWLSFNVFPASAQEPTMDMEAFYGCLEVADADDAISRNACIGTASQSCIGEYFTASGKANCWSMETVLWDDFLNHSYRNLRDANVGQAFVKQLRTAQRAWISMRDADCGLYAAMGIAGARESQLLESCNLDHTANRANALLELEDIVRQVGN
jgi:uncharacterized protein YecT (DUF1311 family)